ncbi:hypothetical protein B4Q13_25100, partial [Lacticaseibacillus rhamnosus]
MIVVALTAHQGLTGVRGQFRNFRNRKKSESRAARTEKGGEGMPEEATEIADKQLIYYRLFDKRIRDHLKTTITSELIAEHKAKPLYTENESNAQCLWNAPNATPYVKDAFHRHIVHGEQDAVNPNRTGTKFGAWHILNVDPGHAVTIGMTLSREPLAAPF